MIGDINSDAICKSFEKKWLKRFESPTTCFTDNGRQFISTTFKKLLDKYGIKHITSAPHNPTGNGIVERINKEIGTVLRISKGERISTVRKNIQIRLNCTNNSMLGCSPIEIFMKKTVFKNVNLTREINLDNIKKRYEYACDEYNKKQKSIRDNVNYKIGDKVFVLNPNPDKVEDIWQGPYEIIRISKTQNNLYIAKNNKKMRV